MCRGPLQLVALASLAAVPLACDGRGGAAPGGGGDPAAGRARVEASSVAAVVDGEPVGLDDVRALMEDADAGLTAREALDALVDELLLAREAGRRGFGGVDVDVERKRALARSLLLEIGDRTTPDAIDEATLRKDYEAQKERFVHGRERRVIHAVVRTGKGGMKDPAAAEALARRIRVAMDGVADGDDFEARAKRFEGEAGRALKIERLPPFAEGTKRFVREFVDAAFAVPGRGGLSPAFPTSFGWHVLLVVEELPAQDVAFAEARETLARERLPSERRLALEQLLERLERENPVFVYESPAPGAE